MNQGRGSALVVALAMVVLFHAGTGEATTWYVGDDREWTFNVVNWPNGKHFEADDTLVFIYNPQFHNVIEVDRAGYMNCVPGNGTVYESGMDQVRIPLGKSFFICGTPGHCQQGMKIAINAVPFSSRA